MTWSFKLRNGDLTLGGTSFGTITGEEKLVQDLRCYLLERMGNDDMHPEFGSLLDGGRLEDGTEQPGFIGGPNSALVELEIENEIQRLVLAYQARQLARAKADRLTYGKTTLHRGEVLLSLSNISIIRKEDLMDISLTLETAANTTIELGLEV